MSWVYGGTIGLFCESLHALMKTLHAIIKSTNVHNLENNEFAKLAYLSMLFKLQYIFFLFTFRTGIVLKKITCISEQLVLNIYEKYQSPSPYAI